MDKSIIKNYLIKNFISEAKNDSSTPGISVTKSVNEKSGKINKDGVKLVDKDINQYDKDLKKNKSEVKDNKFNYNSTEEMEYHNDMEIMNGQEMIEYDREPNKLFSDKAKESIEGSSRMGNKGGKGVGNAEESWGASSDDFGKEFVKRVKATTKKRNDATDSLISFGDDIETVKKGEKPMSKHSALKENHNIQSDLGAGYTHFALLNGKIADGWDYTGQDNESIKYYSKEDLKNNFPDKKLRDFTITTKKNLIKKGIDPSDTNNWYKINESDEIENKNIVSDKPYGTEDEYEFYNSLNKNNNDNQQIKESMKRLKFKKLFNGVGNALKMIPESYKVDNKIFEMTDGIENYRIRWEGALNEGKAVILLASDNKLVNEDIQRMKNLMGYKPEETLGTSKKVSRLTESAIFSDILAKTRVLLEGEDIEDQTASEGEWDEINVPQANDAKKDIEGSTSDDKGTQAPNPKEGEWDEINVPQASDAKKDIEGSVPTEPKNNVPAPKEGFWDEINVPQASEAKKDVTMKENEEKEDSSVNNEDPKSQDSYVHEEEYEDDEEMVDESIKLMVSESTGKLYVVGATEKPFPVPVKDNSKALKNPKKYISEILKK